MEIGYGNSNRQIQISKDKHFERVLFEQAKKHDKVFAILFAFQYVVASLFSILVSPLTWNGSQSSIHMHVFTAVILGGIIAGAPIFLIWQEPGRKLNQWVIAAAQMMYSILFIHLMSGRIETHFHIFGSLAFLAFYRDFRIILFATAVTLCDHLVRGEFWPQSVYGVLTATPWRAIEHAMWIVFEDIVLYFSILNGRNELLSLSLASAELSFNLENIERIAEQRTQELREASNTILVQQQNLIGSAKMSALGEMASSIAHEIKNPLSIILGISTRLKKNLVKSDFDLNACEMDLDKIDNMGRRINKIINGLRSFARQSDQDEMEMIQVQQIIDDTLELCKEKFKNTGVELILNIESGLELQCRAVQITQVIMNLLSNAYDATLDLPEKWVELKVEKHMDKVLFKVTDSGHGISPEIVEKIMLPFYTTKPAGKGTGLGLSISRTIIQTHGGDLNYDTSSAHTCFLVELPAAKNRAGAADDSKAS